MKSWVYATRLCACQTIAVMIAATFSTNGQVTNFHRLHSFGDASQMGSKPSAGLLVGSDGWLYGTTTESGIARQGVVFKLRPDGSDYSVLHHFRGGTNDGAQAEAELIEGSDGALYGTTRGGGPSSLGTAFKINKGGSGFSILHHFAGPGDGRVPTAALIEASDDKLYGTTYQGGAGGFGTVFRINKDGSGYGLVHDFATNGSEGAFLFGSVVEARDGSLYGVTASRGTNGAPAGYGTLFKVNKDGLGFTVLKNFQGPPTEPRNTQAGLIQGSDGALYGVSPSGGSADAGCIFSVNTEGQDFKLLYSFGPNEAPHFVVERLIEGLDGALYGTTVAGGLNGGGTVFRINKDGSDFTIVDQFHEWVRGFTPRCRLAQAPSGELFGTTESGGLPNGGIVFGLQTNQTDHRVVRQFLWGGGDARLPEARLAEGPDGVLYGTGSSGGEAGTSGALFRINRDGTGYRTLHHFGLTPSEGFGAYSGVIVGRDGKLYGATEGGGNGWGTVYKLNRDGSGYEILYQFQPEIDGQFPYATLLQASDGFLYGCTRGPGPGTIFKVSTNGAGFSTLRFLTGSTDGSDPHFPLIEGSDGFLYGIAPVGGSFGGGTVFRIARDGNNFMVLRHFLNSSGEGNQILGGLLQGTDGALYGSTSRGGIERGTVFKINKDGSGYVVLHNFTSSDRALWPFGSLVEGFDGAVYGNAFINANGEYGAVYKLNKNGSGFMLVHQFTGLDGNSPAAPLLMASDGAFYGSATAGGDLGFGTLFRIGHQMTLQKTNSFVHFQLTGVPGYMYTVRRSANLRDWSSWLTMGPMPASTRYFFSDSTPPTPWAFYVAAPSR